MFKSAPKTDPRRQTDSANSQRIRHYNDSIVRAVCCQCEHKQGHNRLYIVVIGVLVPYRRFGVGNMLLSHMMAPCESDILIESVFLHVQANNDKAIQLYKKFGFKAIDRVDNFKRITPDDAFHLEKIVNNDTKSATVSNTANCGDIMAE